MLLTALTGLARAIPLPLGYRLADAAARGHWALSPGRRRAVEGNLRALCGESELARTLSLRVFRNYGRFLFEFLRGPEIPELSCEFRGRERLESALARGRGVVLTIVHTGNWEVAGARLARSGIRIHAVAGIQLRRQWTEELRRRQEACGIRILPPQVASWRELPRILARNEVLALLVDGDLFQRGTRVEMAGRRVDFPSGPARLAARTGAALLPAFSLRHESGALTAEFLEEVHLSDDSKDTIARATGEIADRLSRVVRDNPEQWMIFRSFFAPAAPSGLSPEGVH